MKKRIIPAIALLTLLGGCGSVSQEQYDKLLSDYEELEMKYEVLDDEIIELRTEIESLQGPGSLHAGVNSQGPSAGPGSQGPSGGPSGGPYSSPSGGPYSSPSGGPSGGPYGSQYSGAPSGSFRSAYPPGPSSGILTVRDYKENFSIDETGESAAFSLYTDDQNIPNCDVTCSISYKAGADITYYELKAAFFLTEMDQYLSDRLFENYTITITTPNGTDRDLTAIRVLNGKNEISGKNRDGKTAVGPDWFADSYAEITNNRYSDADIIDLTGMMEFIMEGSIHYH